MNYYQKICKGIVLLKYYKSGGLAYEAEKSNGKWNVYVYEGKKDISGEYTEAQFDKEIRRYFK